jgi:hypothetical protein
MCDMDSAADVSPQYRWLLALCASAILLGLAAHLITDATGRSLDLTRAVSGRVTTCSLLAGLMMPPAAVIGVTTTIVLVLTGCNLLLPFWFFAPLVRPPISLRHCMA